MMHPLVHITVSAYHSQRAPSISSTRMYMALQIKYEKKQVSQPPGNLPAHETQIVPIQMLIFAAPWKAMGDLVVDRFRWHVEAICKLSKHRNWATSMLWGAFQEWVIPENFPIDTYNTMPDSHCLWKSFKCTCKCKRKLPWDHNDWSRSRGAFTWSYLACSPLSYHHAGSVFQCESSTCITSKVVFFC